MILVFLGHFIPFSSLQIVNQRLNIIIRSSEMNISWPNVDEINNDLWPYELFTPRRLEGIKPGHQTKTLT